MFLLFIAGFLSGVLFLLILAILFLFNIFGKRHPVDQFPTIIPANKTRIPSELKAFLRSALDGNGSEWESCSSLSLLLHFIFQEHKDTRQFRRWMYKKLQLELNDVTAGSSAARIIQGIQIRDLEAGTNSPLVKNVRIESFKVADDDPDMFEVLVLLLDLDYRGGFQMSVDALMALGKFAQLSVKLLSLSGRARLTINRQPFAHWSFSFVENPQMELKIESQFQGHSLRHLIPLIGSAFRKVLQLKHVWPNYKLRFRPFFQNPLFNPSPNMAALDHIKLAGSGLEVTVLSSSRLNISHGQGAHRIYCKLILEKRPYGGVPYRRNLNDVGSTTFREASHILSVLLAFSRKGPLDKLGLTFRSAKDGKEVRVEKVEPGSNAEKCGFRVGDCLVAVNNVPVRNERQASRILTDTAGDLLVLVEREMDGGNEEQREFTLSPPESPISSYFSLKVAPSSPPAADDSQFILPDTPPKEYRVRDEPERRNTNESLVKPKKSITIEDYKESIEMRPLLNKEKRPTSLQETPRKNLAGISTNLSTAATPITPYSPEQNGEEEEEKKPIKMMTIVKKKRGTKIMVKKMVNGSSSDGGRGGSVKAAKITRKGRKGKMRRSRSESSLIRLKVPKVRIQKSEEDLADQLDRPTTGMQDEEDEETTAEEEGGTSLGIETMPGDCSSEKASTSTGTKEEENGGIIMGPSNKKSHREKLHEMAISSGKKINNMLMFKKKKMVEGAGGGGINLVDSSSKAELAVEANDDAPIEFNGGMMDHLKKPNGSNKETRKKMNPRKKSKSPSPSSFGGVEKSKSIDGFGLSLTNNSGALEKRTKSVPITKNPMWGQSLHFSLQKESTMYLNVLVYAELEEKEKTTEGGQNEDPLVGYTSIYVPRIVDDCILTLSNSHRERFHLRGPRESENILMSELEELSRHNGFDARLCFGDIILGFRFFPTGLPEELMGKDKLQLDHHHSPINGQQMPTTSSTIAQTPSPPAAYEHKWVIFNSKQLSSFHVANNCTICGGKIWLKRGHRCEICHLVCHNNAKCQERAKSHECRPNGTFNFNDDEAFEELDPAKELATGIREVEKGGEEGGNGTLSTAGGMPTGASAAEEKRKSITTIASTTPDVNEQQQQCRRRRIAEKVHSTFKHIRRAKVDLGEISNADTKPTTSSNNKQSDESPIKRTNSDSPLRSSAAEQSETEQPLIAVSEVLDLQFLKSLEGLPAELIFTDLRFEPGNAYNPQVICETKAKGQRIFCELQPMERKTKIDAQIDRVQGMIEKVTRERRSIPDKTGEEFDHVDNRLQALTLIMLLYCSGLSDCVDKEEEEEEKINSKKSQTKQQQSSSVVEEIPKKGKTNITP